MTYPRKTQGLLRGLYFIQTSMNVMCSSLLDNAFLRVISAFDGLEGTKLAKSSEFNLILLDIMLPYKSGDEILKEIRTWGDVPVIILSAKDMVGTKIDLLKLGADDYITKPFDLGEVAARVAVQLRRAHKQMKEAEVLSYKDLVVEKGDKRVTVNGQEVELTAKEYSMLELLLNNPNKVFSKANIYEAVWNEEYLGDDNAVKTHMSNLRSKLKKVNAEAEYIETVWGLGYRLYRG